jgi:hypothetical protein
LGRKAPDAYRTIAEAAVEVGVAAHVLRFWETRFSFIKPLKRAGGRRFYRPADIAMLVQLRHALHEEGLSIKAAQALPTRRWRAPATPFSPMASDTPTESHPDAGAGLSAMLRAALARAIRAKTGLDGVIGSSTALGD